MLPTNLVQFNEKPLKVLNDGHVQLIDVMGSEQDIVDAARVSYGAGTKRLLKDRSLMRYLLRNTHTSPFEMCELKIRIRVPMDVWRQWIRHRTASVNEYSTRYSEAIDSAVVTDPEQWRTQSTDNKQGSGNMLTMWADGFLDPMQGGVDEENYANGGWVNGGFYASPGSYLSHREMELQEMAREVYEERLKMGVAREQARKDLPLSTYTEAYWKIDLHNLLHFLRLRLHPHAQKEIREYSEAIAVIVKAWVPTVWEAFEDYQLLAEKFSRMELNGLRAVLGYYAEKNTVSGLLERVILESGLEGREADEFVAKIKKTLRK